MFKNNKSLLLFSIIILVILMFGCSTDKKSNGLNTENKINVAVSIVPQETFVRAVAGDKVDVITMIPPGMSPENFAPSPDIMEKFSKAKIYFTIGVPSEKVSILPKISDFNSEVKIVKMEDEVSKVYDERKFESGERDPHIWLSPKRAKIMVKTIADELSEMDPSNKCFYEGNAEKYISELDKVDVEIRNSLSSLKKKTFICYHPAFGYFADDYGLKMVALESEGKEATIEDFQSVIDMAKKENIKVIFYQAEVDSRQSKILASEIGGKVEMIEPLSSDYLNNLKKMSNAFKNAMEVN